MRENNKVLIHTRGKRTCVAMSGKKIDDTVFESLKTSFYLEGHNHTDKQWDRARKVAERLSGTVFS